MTQRDDVEAAIDAGADAIGLNLWPASPRSVSLATAVQLADGARGRVSLVAVTVDLQLAELQQIVAALHPDWLQLHDPKSLDLVAELQPHAFAAIGLGDKLDVERALQVAGPWVLVDARNEVQRGGTGTAPPAALVSLVIRARSTILAGGLRADNVEDTVRRFQPYGVDAASGLETAPGRKDAKQMAAFVRAARRGAMNV